MKRSRAILAVVLLLVVAAVLFLFWSPSEPVYQGRPISEWIQEMSGPVGDSAGAPSSEALPKLLQQDPGREIVPCLCRVLHRGRGIGQRIFAAFYPKLPPAIAARLPALNPARDAELRYRAALLLYYLGPTASNAVSTLTYALHDDNAEVRRMAATALSAVAPGLASTALGAALGDPVASVRRAALKALAHSDDPASAVPQIAAALKDADAGVRVEAARVLKNLGPKAKSAVPALIEALKDTEQDVILFAAQALGRIGPDAHLAVPALQATLQNAPSNSETTLRWALRQIAPETLAPTGK